VQSLNRNLSSMGLELYCRPNYSVRSAKELPILKRKIQFSLTSEDESAGCATDMQSLDLRLSGTNLRRHVFHTAKKNRKKKSFSNVPDILYFSCDEVGHSVA
jgi:hypothetical protein